MILNDPVLSELKQMKGFKEFIDRVAHASTTSP